MSLVFVTLRWDAVDAGRFEEIRRCAPSDGELPAGCLDRKLRHQGSVLTATETWDTDVSEGPMDQLADAVHTAGVDRAPQTAMFRVPAIFAVAYRKTAPADEPAVAAAVPQPRAAAAQERDAVPAHA